MKDIRKIKALMSQLSILTGEAEALKVEIANRQRELAAKTKAVESLSRQIESMKKNGELKVSEHAIVRYLERVKGVSIAEIEREILSDSVVSYVEKLGGNGKFPNGEYQVVMKDFTVTTIV